jgi:hypothetical protein
MPIPLRNSDPRSPAIGKRGEHPAHEPIAEAEGRDPKRTPSKPDAPGKPVAPGRQFLKT